MSNILNIPQSAPISLATGNWTQEWFQWITNPKFLSIETGEALGPESGGTGLSTAPAGDQLLIGNGSGGYTLTSTIPGAALPAFTGDATKAAGGTVLTLATVNTTPGLFGSSSTVGVFTVNAKGLITNAVNTPIDTALGNFSVVGRFGCNGKTAQASASLNAAISATAGGAYTATEQTMLNDIKALLNQIRLALVNNGIGA